MKVCFDTCSVVDILGKSDWFFPAYCAYDVAVMRGFQPCLSVSSTTDICKRAYQSEMKDYEDALIAYSAQSAGADIIITRNKKDFKDAPLPALSPEEFLRDFKPDNVKYDEAELFG